MRMELREAIYTLLAERREVLRPSEILHALSSDARFMLWPNCMHVTAQLYALVEHPRKVRRVWMPLIPTRFQRARGHRGGFRGWCVGDLSRDELNNLRRQTAALKEAPFAGVCEVR